MNISTILIVIGLSLNTVASIILLIPNLNFEKSFKDDLVTTTDVKNHKYFQGKDIKNLKIGIIGFILFIFGFVLQIIGILIGIYN